MVGWWPYVVLLSGYTARLQVRLGLGFTQAILWKEGALRKGSLRKDSRSVQARKSKTDPGAAGGVG